jgi:hypothetical protein
MTCTLAFEAHAQTQKTATIVETLADGSYIVEISGKKFRALDAVRMHAIDQRKQNFEQCSLDLEKVANNLDKATKDNAIVVAERDKLREAFDKEKLIAALADSQKEVWKGRAEKWEVAYTGEHALRLQADDLLTQAEKLMKRGALSSFFESPVGQIIRNVATPVVQTVMTKLIR